MLKNDRIINANTFNLLETERNYRRHVTRLVSIALDKNPGTQQKRNIEVQTARLKKCQNATKRVKTLQLLQMQKDNDRLLGKLLRINQGDKKSVTGSGPPLTIASARASVEASRNTEQPQQHKSLNQVARKREVLKIINENVRLTEKIIFQESKFARDKLAKEYDTSREYSMRLRKLRPNDDKTVKIGHGGIVLSKDLRIQNSYKFLPPLKQEVQNHALSFAFSRASSVPRLPSERTSAYESRNLRDKYNDLSSSVVHQADMTYLDPQPQNAEGQRDSVGSNGQAAQEQQEIENQQLIEKYLVQPEKEPSESAGLANKNNLSAILEQSESGKSPEKTDTKGKKEEKKEDKNKAKKK